MDEDWISEVDDGWVAENLADIERCFQMPEYRWDAHGFGGVLSFAQLLIGLEHGRIISDDRLNLGFLDDPTLVEKTIYALQSMRDDEDSQEHLAGVWSELLSEIEVCLSALGRMNRRAVEQ